MWLPWRRKREIPADIYFSVVDALERITGGSLSNAQPRLIDDGKGGWVATDMDRETRRALEGYLRQHPFTDKHLAVCSECQEIPVVEP